MMSTRAVGTGRAGIHDSVARAAPSPGQLLQAALGQQVGIGESLPEARLVQSTLDAGQRIAQGLPQDIEKPGQPVAEISGAALAGFEHP